MMRFRADGVRYRAEDLLRATTSKRRCCRGADAPRKKSHAFVANREACFLTRALVGGVAAEGTALKGASRRSDYLTQLTLLTN